MSLVALFGEKSFGSIMMENIQVILTLDNPFLPLLIFFSSRFYQYDRISYYSGDISHIAIPLARANGISAFPYFRKFHLKRV